MSVIRIYVVAARSDSALEPSFKKLPNRILRCAGHTMTRDEFNAMAAADVQTAVAGVVDCLVAELERASGGEPDPAPPAAYVPRQGQIDLDPKAAFYEDLDPGPDTPDWGSEP